nr:MAG TPA: hypothetical protein [Caudoviricetes sp.]
MKLISPGSRVKFHTVEQIHSPDHDPLKTEFQAIFLSGTVHDDDGNRVTVWTDDSRTFRVPYEYITEIQDPTDPFTYEFPNLVPPSTVSFDEIISVL